MWFNYATKWVDFQTDEFWIHISRLITCLPYKVNWGYIFHHTESYTHSSSMSGSFVGRDQLTPLLRSLMRLWLPPAHLRSGKVGTVVLSWRHPVRLRGSDWELPLRSCHCSAKQSGHIEYNWRWTLGTQGLCPVMTPIETHTCAQWDTHKSICGRLPCPGEKLEVT